MALGLYILLRLNKIEWVKVIGLLGFNAFLFLIACSESSRSGVYLHFVSASAVAIALYRYEQWKRSFLFVSLSIMFLILVNVKTFNILPFREHTEFIDNLLFTLNVLVSAFIAGYSMYMILSMNHDAENYLRQKQLTIEAQNKELQKTNEELDRFVYSVSHDLRAPLSNIKGLTALMTMDTQTPREEFIKMIESSANRMEIFIRDIEHYSRNSRMELNMEYLNLHDLVADIIKSLSHFDNALKVSIENQIPADYVVYADSYRLRIILNNLINNAIKYADLAKEKPYVRVSADLENGFHHIKITDNGIGIKEEHKQKVFGMFYRASASSKGSGLGLYIVKESADKLQSQVTVQSEYGKGSVFSLRLQMIEK